MKQRENYSSSIVEDILSETKKGTKRKIRNKMLIAAKIADAMRIRGWNNNRLMEEMGKNTPSVISKWLSGTHNFTVDTLSELEEILNIRLMDLEEKKEEKGRVFRVEVSQTVSRNQEAGSNSIGGSIVTSKIFSTEFGKSFKYRA